MTSPAPSARIPGPRGWPVLGMLPDLRRDFLSTLNAAGLHGPVVRLRNPLFPFYLLTDPAPIAHVLQDNAANWRKSRLLALLRPLLGQGLVTSDGPLWQSQRRMLQPLFHRDSLAGFVPAMEAAVERLLRRWEPLAARGATVDVAAEMGGLALEIIADVLFGSRMEDPAAIRRDLGIAQAHMSARYWRLLPAALADALPTAGNRRHQAALERLDRLIYRRIAAHAERPRPDEPQPDAPLADGLLSALLAARDAEGRPMSRRQLRDEVMTLFIAGHETTANALAWLWLLLARHPEAEERLPADTAFLRRVIQESLRLYPPIWGFSREAVADDRLGGHPVRGGSVVFIAAWLLHRDPAFWERPERFDPDRFLPERTAGRHRLAYLPFGAGPRVCLGSQFAMMEMTAVVAGIARRYRLSLPPGHEVVPEAVVTLRPRGGLPMILSPKA